MTLGVRLATLAVAFAAGLNFSALAQVQGSDNPTPHLEPRGKAIVGGHRLQPTPGELGKPGVTEDDAKTVDELYKKLIEQSRQQLEGGANASTAAPPHSETPKKTTP